MIRTACLACLAASVMLAGSKVLAGPVGKVESVPGSKRPASEAGSTATDAATDAERERACLDDLKLLYPGDNGCYQLLTTGPCKSGEWLVLDARAPERLVLTCDRERCATHEVLWQQNGRCYHRFRDRAKLCRHEGNQLVTNPFGLGECACPRSPPHARDARDVRGPTNSTQAGGAGGACYPLYHRGPCPDGQVFVHKANATADQGVCVRDPCSQPPGQDKDKPLVLWPTSEGGDGRCHALGSTAMGRCPEPSSFGINPQTLRPTCIHLANAVLPGQCSEGHCIPTKTSTSAAYILDLHKAHQKHRAG